MFMLRNYLIISFLQIFQVIYNLNIFEDWLLTRIVQLNSVVLIYLEVMKVMMKKISCHLHPSPFFASTNYIKVKGHHRSFFFVGDENEVGRGTMTLNPSSSTKRLSQKHTTIELPRKCHFLYSPMA